MSPLSMSRKQWYDEIWKLSASGTARKYDIPYGQFMQQMKASGIPIPPSGYWTRLNFGKPVESIPLAGDPEEILAIPCGLSGRKSGAQTPPAASAALPAEVKSDTAVSKTAAAAEALNVPPEAAEEPPASSEHADRPQEQIRSLYDRTALYRDVWQYPIEKAANLYRVSAAAMEKICGVLDIPLPKNHDSKKLRDGYPIEKRPPLPERTPGVKTADPQTDGLAPPLQSRLDALDFLSEEDRVVLGVAAACIRIPEEKERMLPAIIAHRKVVAAWKQEHKKDMGYHPHNAPKPPFLAKGISNESLPRVFHIIDALAKALEPLGGKLEDHPVFVVCGERLSLDFSEAKDTVLHTLTKEENRKLLEYQDAKKRSRYASEPDFPQYDHPYNGRLTLKIPFGRSFRDSTARLEERLGEILLAMYAAAESIRQERLKREEAERKRQEEERLWEERRKRRELELDRTIALQNMAEDYDTACKIRRYIEACIAAHPDEDLSEWVEWASAKADWYDPTVAREDAFFGIREHAKDREQKDLRQSRRKWWL